MKLLTLLWVLLASFKPSISKLFTNFITKVYKDVIVSVSQMMKLKDADVWRQVQDSRAGMSVRIQISLPQGLGPNQGITGKCCNHFTLAY